MTPPPPPPKKQSDGRLKPHSLQQHVLGDPNPRLSWKAAAYICVMESCIRYWSKKEYQGLTLKKNENDWLLVVRAKDGHQPVVCFVYGETPVKAIQTFAVQLVRYAVTWKPDKFG